MIGARRAPVPRIEDDPDFQEPYGYMLANRIAMQPKEPYWVQVMLASKVLECLRKSMGARV